MVADSVRLLSRTRHKKMDDSALITLLIHDTLLLLAVINPIGNIPIYVDLTKGMTRHKQIRVINMAIITSLCLVVTFGLIGNWSLKNLFGVTLNEFKIAGGILLFIVATRGVMSGIRSFTMNSQDYRTLAVFPLAFPVITGPGTLAVTIVLAQHSGISQMVLIAFMTFIIVFVIARNSHHLVKLLGPYAGMIIPRLLYIFLAAKAVAMVLEGTVEFLKQNLLTTLGG